MGAAVELPRSRGQRWTPRVRRRAGGEFRLHTALCSAVRLGLRVLLYLFIYFPHFSLFYFSSPYRLYFLFWLLFPPPPPSLLLSFFLFFFFLCLLSSSFLLFPSFLPPPPFSLSSSFLLLTVHSIFPSPPFPPPPTQSCPTLPTSPSAALRNENPLSKSCPPKFPTPPQRTPALHHTLITTCASLHPNEGSSAQTEGTPNARGVLGHDLGGKLRGFEG